LAAESTVALIAPLSLPSLISEAQVITAPVPRSAFMSGSYPEQPRHQTVTRPVTARAMRTAIFGRFMEREY